jgi:hypothetical protein
MNLTPWSEIENDYADALLLGNGASIAVADSLHYNSLYEAARDEGFLTDPVTAIFEYFDTTDFEFVLRMVANAHMVNDHLGVEEDATAETYDTIKTALIETVRQIHPEHDEITASMTPISNFLSRFDTVFSLNYDLIVYWAMMHGNSMARGHRFKDCFMGEAFNENYDFLRQPHGDLEFATLVFYPHGNLALVSDLYGTETKIKAGFTDLITEIAQSWTLGQTTPLFVSEGDHRGKLQAIRRNNYLNAVYRELSRTPESLVVYGWAGAAQDRHILSAIGRSNVSRVAVAVYTGTDDWEHQCYMTSRRIRSALGITSSDIVFFDSADEGVWLNDTND